MGNYVTIHAGRDYTLRKPLKDLEPLLDESFFRTGRSFLVNLRFVKEVTRTQVTLTDASTVPLSRRRYDAIHHAIISYF
nr:LytTR family DNA-binding domain-containing protein [uncultured Acetatifactor sp.]